MELSDDQKRLILEANEVYEKSMDAFIDMGAAKTQADKLRLLEPYHALQLQEIELLRQAGDPDANIKLMNERANYRSLLGQYRAMSDPTPEPTPGQLFEAARLVIVRAHHRARDDQQR